MAGAPGPLLVMGAGSIGCFLGGALAAIGAEVCFVGRPRVIDALRARGLRLTDLAGADRLVDATRLRLETVLPAGLRPALVLLTVKSGATAAAATELGAALPDGTPVVSMQNGVANAGVVRAAAPGLHVLAGMVPFNVAETGPGSFHKGTTGMLAAQDDAALRPWLPAFAAAGLPLALHADLLPLQWGKLLLNLNNPVNALSGLPLRDQLLGRGYRVCLAALIDEALAALRAAGVRPAKVAPLPATWLPALLRCPTPLFRLAAARMLRIDARARSSMADDLQLGRPTEIDALCGEVVRLARAAGRDAPLNARMQALVEARPARREAMTAERMRQALGL